MFFMILYKNVSNFIPIAEKQSIPYRAITGREPEHSLLEHLADFASAFSASISLTSRRLFERLLNVFFVKFQSF